MTMSVLRRGRRFVVVAICALLACSVAATATASPVAGGPRMPAVAQVCSTAPSSIPINFHGFTVPQGQTYTIWFSGVMVVQNVSTSNPVTIGFTGQTLTGSSFSAAVPNSSVTFSSSFTDASATFGPGWTTTTPYGLSGNTFLSGFAQTFTAPTNAALVVPDQTVNWAGTFSTTVAGAKVQWQAAAGLYTGSHTNASASPKPTDATTHNPYAGTTHASDHAGTPEGYLAPTNFFMGNGGTGGGGSNFTGSYSSTVSAFPCAPDTTPPLCRLTAIVPGPPKQIMVTVQDSGSGIKTIAETHTNATVNIPAFTQGTTSPIVVTATKSNPVLGSTLKLVVNDVAGNQTVCDPVLPGTRQAEKIARARRTS